MARPLGEMVNHRRVFAEESNTRMLEGMRDRARLCLIAIDDSLAGQDYLMGGELTAAEVTRGQSMFLVQRVGAMEEGEFPNLTAYFARLKARPAFGRAIA